MNGYKRNGPFKKYPVFGSFDLLTLFVTWFLWKSFTKGKNLGEKSEKWERRVEEDVRGRTCPLKKLIRAVLNRTNNLSHWVQIEHARLIKTISRIISVAEVNILHPSGQTKNNNQILNWIDYYKYQPSFSFHHYQQNLVDFSI